MVLLLILNYSLKYVELPFILKIYHLILLEHNMLLEM